MELLKYEQLDKLLLLQNGILRTADLQTIGVSRAYFATYMKDRGLERIAHGVYLSPDSLGDDFFILQSRWPKAVFSHEAALYLWGLAEREPLPITVTLKAGYNATNLTTEGIKVYKVKPELYELGKAETTSPGGHLVTVYDAERSICDLFRSRSQVEVQDLHSALQNYLRGKKKNIPLLMRYAKALHVDRIMKPYLEALLA